MPLPASVTTIPVHGKILRADASGTPAVGTVKFAIPQTLRDTTGNVLLGPVTYLATLDANGEFTLSLPATDDSDISPSGWVYTVTIATGEWVDEFLISVPVATAGTLELADVAPAATPPAVVNYALSSHAHGGVYLPLSGGGIVTGDVTIAGTGKAYRFRRSGSALDNEATGADWYISVWSGTAFDGTQRNYMRLESGAQILHLIGHIAFGTGAFDEIHTIDAAGNAIFDGLVAKGKNGLSDLRICGRKTTAGAPTSGTWLTGDAIIDSAGAWHLCTAGGTPGTWT